MHRVTTQFTYLEPMCSSRCTRLPSGSFIQNPEKKRTSKWNVKVNALFLRTRTQSCAKLTLRGARLNVIDLLSILPINGLSGSKWGTSSRGFFPLFLLLLLISFLFLKPIDEAFFPVDACAKVSKDFPRKTAPLPSLPLSSQIERSLLFKIC